MYFGRGLVEEVGAWDDRGGLRRLLGDLGRKDYWAGLREKLPLLEGLDREDCWEDLR